MDQLQLFPPDNRRRNCRPIGMTTEKAGNCSWLEKVFVPWLEPGECYTCYQVMEYRKGRFGYVLGSQEKREVWDKFKEMNKRISARYLMVVKVEVISRMTTGRPVTIPGLPFSRYNLYEIGTRFMIVSENPKHKAMIYGNSELGPLEGRLRGWLLDGHSDKELGIVQVEMQTLY